MEREKKWIDEILSEMKDHLEELRDHLIYHMNQCINKFGAMQMKKLECMPVQIDLAELHSFCNAFDSEIEVMHQQIILQIREFVERMDKHIFIAVRLQQTNTTKYFSDMTEGKGVLRKYHPGWNMFEGAGPFQSLLQSRNLLRESIIHELDLIKERMDQDWRIFEKSFRKCLAEYFISL